MPVNSYLFKASLRENINGYILYHSLLVLSLLVYSHTLQMSHLSTMYFKSANMLWKRHNFVIFQLSTKQPLSEDI